MVAHVNTKKRMVSYYFSSPSLKLKRAIFSHKYYHCRKVSNKTTLHPLILAFYCISSYNSVQGGQLLKSI